MNICYTEAIKAYLDDTFTDEKSAAWDERLKAVFNRGFWDGYYLGQRLGEWTRNYGSAATERKIYVGKGIKYFSNLGVSEFLVEAAEVSVGDKLYDTGRSACRSEAGRDGKERSAFLNEIREDTSQRQII